MENRKTSRDVRPSVLDRDARKATGENPRLRASREPLLCRCSQRRGGLHKDVFDALSKSVGEPTVPPSHVHHRRSWLRRLEHTAHHVPASASRIRKGRAVGFIEIGDGLPELDILGFLRHAAHTIPMNELIRPPAELVEKILRTCASDPLITRERVRDHARAALSGSQHQFPTVQQYWILYRELTLAGTLEKNKPLEKALRVKDIRTDSGVAPITVLTKPYPCPGKCVYCPTEVMMPKSYVASEPAAARALSLRFDPYQQTFQRVGSLENNGHEAKKIELIVKGGTWSSYRWDYRQWFIKRCFEAANALRNDTVHAAQGAAPSAPRPTSPPAPSPSLGEGVLSDNMSEPSPSEGEGRVRWSEGPQNDGSSQAQDQTEPPLTGSDFDQGPSLREAQKINETADYRIIGLTIETRPDWVNAKEIIRLRELGCTRVELGVQTLQNDVLDLTKRGHHIDATIRATALLKQAGFKVDFHILPGQPGSSPKKDLEDFKTLFTDPKYRPDMIKLYPCVVLPSAELHAWAAEGKFVALEGEPLRELLISMQSVVPRYCRISRLIRDFPENEISYGSKITNLRSILEDEMKRRGIICQCLRCREVGHVKDIDPATVTPQLFEEWFDNAGGREVFLTMEDVERKAVFAFCRLRLPPTSEELRAHNDYKDDPIFLRESKAIDEAFPSLMHTACVRELHTYGPTLDLKQTNVDGAQHKGYGRRLMERAEEIAKREGYETMSVISGIGVREYYKNFLGYEEKETYMMKKLG